MAQVWQLSTQFFLLLYILIANLIFNIKNESILEKSIADQWYQIFCLKTKRQCAVFVIQSCPSWIFSGNSLEL